MSFISVIEQIGTDVLKGLGIFAGIAIAAAPIVTTFNPAAGTILGLVANTILQVEQLIPGQGKGAIKKPITTTIVQANLPAGSTLTPAQLSAMIDALVAAFNALAG